MITFKRADGEEYSLEYGLVDVCDVCNKENHSQLNGSPETTMIFPLNLQTMHCH